jgi:hypothetical protein
MQLVSEPWNRRVDGVVPLLSWLLLSVAHFPISLKKKGNYYYYYYYEAQMECFVCLWLAL